MPDASRAGSNPVRLLFSFDGRISRRWFWIGMLAAGAILYGVGTLLSQALSLRGARSEIVLISMAILVSGYLAAAVATKRLHDRGKSGWWCLIYGAVPLVLYGLALQIQGSAADEPSLVAVTCNTGALAIWLFAIVDLGILKGVSETSGTAT